MSRRRRHHSQPSPARQPVPVLTWLPPAPPAPPEEVQLAAIARELSRADLV